MPPTSPCKCLLQATDISHDIILTGCWQIAKSVLAVQLDHKVPILLVYIWSLRGILPTEVFWKRVHLYLVYLIHVEPVGNTRNHQVAHARWLLYWLDKVLTVAAHIIGIVWDWRLYWDFLFFYELLYVGVMRVHRKGLVRFLWCHWFLFGQRWLYFNLLRSFLLCF